MAVKVIIGAKARELSYNDVIPELDDDQLNAGFAMADHGAMLLWSDPGAGKTLTAIHALMVVHEDHKPNPTVLIVCPNIAVRTWIRWLTNVYNELGLDAVIQYVDKSNRAVTPETTHAIVTYGSLSRKSDKLTKALHDFNADVLICDESDNLTGFDSARTAFVFGPKPTFNGGLASLSRWAWFLTGTPIPRYNDGLFPVLRSRFRDRLEDYGVETYEKFIETFCTTEVVLYGNMRQPKVNVNGSRQNKRLRELLFQSPPYPIAIRIKLVLADRPAHKEITIYPDFSKEYLALEQEVCNPASQLATPVSNDAEGDEGAEVGRYVDPRLAVAMRMMGVESAPEVVKIAGDELNAKRAARDVTGLLLLYWHHDVGNELENALTEQGWRVGRIDGTTSQDNDAEVERAFNVGELDVVVGQIKAMGVAINLQGNCDTVIFAEESFSDAQNQQAYQRVWRRGQSRLVRVWWCRPLAALADMKPSVTERKRQSAGEVLDGK